ncbi:hypothetical protein XENTR_v10009299 [Xenopus tropicalis]|uniref:Uncharacterized LOC101732842 n=1 Tax=Xenopus tropicalis TaxID=8364 RepID=A0A6I8RAM2_XENTR|nr:uncharacterized protein LOC101732842 [Xenopus tropicalis]KAE8618177.1 hypothetical protein XENTR_v10009299 [Xenopus tropicalis]|eukprot:XP_004912702.1 PREDICTED: uncharacterized protein LOC101732842 [Xenopus tropicalis]
MPQDCSQTFEWAYASSCSESPASSSDSYSLSPGYAHLAPPKETFCNYHQAQVYDMTSHQTQESPQGSRRTRCRMVGPQRQSASEREKMRMRNLSKALQNLRRYLPPSVVPAGRTLTKIETLRLTIRYISHLSSLLGLNEEVMSHKREPVLGMQPASYSKMTDSCQDMTCRVYQQQPQTTLYHDASNQCSKATFPTMQPASRHTELEAWVPSCEYNMKSNSLSEFGLSSHCSSRLTHMYQLGDYRATDFNSVTAQIPREIDSGLLFSDPLTDVDQWLID